MKRPAERRPGLQPIQTRFEPSHFGETCVADAYACLVPPVWRRPGTVPSIPLPKGEREVDRGGAHGEEERQCG
jgi:hypothetical protein